MASQTLCSLRTARVLHSDVNSASRSRHAAFSPVHQSLTDLHSRRMRPGRLTVKATSSSSSSSSSPSSDGRKQSRWQSRWDPLLADSDVGCPVPPEQQPVNEYGDLAEALFFSWATMGPFNLSMRLGAVGLFFTLAIGFPISAATFDPQREALQCVLASIGGGLFTVSLATARLYLGWQYVGARLSSATVEYEETGWYDGQVWVKTPELLARDRLLASYRVKPVLRRLQTSLLGLGASLALIVALLAFLPPYQPTAAPPPAYMDYMEDSELDPALFKIVRAEERPYIPSTVEALEGEGEEEDDRDQAAGVLGSASQDMYWRLHSPPALAEEVPVAVSHGDFGFEFLAAAENTQGAPEAEEDALFSRSDAWNMAGDLRGIPDVVIIGSRQRIQGDSEDTYKAVEGPEDLSVLGAGVRSQGRGAKDARISDHLGIGPNGELQLMRSLRPSEY